MIPKYRQTFNNQFSQETYQKVKDLVLENCDRDSGFRISESPIFLPDAFREKLMDASNSIIAQIKSMSATELEKAIPPNCFVPNDSKKPEFLAIDFGICKDEK